MLSQSVATKFFNRDSIQYVRREIVGCQDRVHPAAEGAIIFAFGRLIQRIYPRQQTAALAQIELARIFLGIFSIVVETQIIKVSLYDIGGIISFQRCNFRVQVLFLQKWNYVCL